MKMIRCVFYIIVAIMPLQFAFSSEKCLPESPTGNITFIRCLSDNLALIERYGRKTIINLQDKEITGVDELSENEQLIMVEYGMWLKYYNKQGDMVAEYLPLWALSDNIIVVRQALPEQRFTYVRFALLDKQTGNIVSPVYDSISESYDGLVAVSQQGKFGYLNTQGEVVIDLQYDFAGDFSEGLARVGKNGKYGFIDLSGKVVMPLIYDDTQDTFVDKRAAVKLAEKWGVINREGQRISDFIYDDIWQYQHGFAIVRKNHKKGFIDRQGNVAVPIIYDDAQAFNNGLARVKQNEQWGLVNTQGKIVVTPAFDGLDYYTENTFLTKKGGLLGLVSDSDEILLPAKYHAITPMRYVPISPVLATVSLLEIRQNEGKKTKKGFYDTARKKLLLAAEYDDYERRGNVLIVTKGALKAVFNPRNLKFLSDWRDWKERVFWCSAYRYSDGEESMLVSGKTGEIIIPIGAYDEIADFSRCVARVKKNGKYGLISTTDSRILLPVAYDVVWWLADNIAKVRKNGREGLITVDGNPLTELIYDEVKSADASGRVIMIEEGKERHISINAQP